ncbi:hypothetical protein COL5a_002727 [Colletotrichum fioriniae]|uniref:uncharacterized protein n=1 Tax=Colletotrichum fioriniae TaxID=710243 RepID=UPI0032DBE093|nr:hypothetical protein COL5a_002727 [Colletotrichum fioriniae]KAJ3950211.1 hypothetical protein N0V96_001355 [Colletotrichum fioriniae]
MVAGHFSRIEYASGGTVPGSLIAEFAKIARDYVNEIQHAEVGLTNPARPHAPTNPSAMQMVQQSSELDAGNNKQVARPTQMTLDLSDEYDLLPQQHGGTVQSMDK